MWGRRIACCRAPAQWSTGIGAANPAVWVAHPFKTKKLLVTRKNKLTSPPPLQARLSTLMRFAGRVILKTSQPYSTCLYKRPNKELVFHNKSTPTYKVRWIPPQIHGYMSCAHLVERLLAYDCGALDVFSTSFYMMAVEDCAIMAWVTLCR